MTLFLKKFAAVAMLLAAVNLAHAQELTLADQLNNLIVKVQAKIDAGKTNESDFAADVTAMDGLIAAQDASNTNVIADLIYKKADLYLVALRNTEKSEQLFREVSQTYPTYRLAEVAAARAEGLRVDNEKRHIREALKPGTVFPDFNVTDMNGKSLSVSNYPGKVVLVDFWATWCPICVIELPSIIKLYKANRKDGLEVIGVTLDKQEEREKLDTFLKKHPDMTWPQYFDGLFWNNKLAVKYGFDETPWNVLVGRDGKIIGTNLHDDALKAAITKALKSK